MRSNEILTLERQITDLESSLSEMTDDYNSLGDTMARISHQLEEKKEALRNHARNISGTETKKAVDTLLTAFKGRYPGQWQNIVKLGNIQRVNPKAPYRAGAMWSKVDERTLQNIYNMFVSVAARALHRNTGAITSRVEQSIQELNMDHYGR